MSALHVYEVLAQAFFREKVDTCFALLGDANMSWAAALESTGCQFIYVRDEHCAVAAAMSWSRLSDRIGIATVTCGPGLTQIMTALPAAVRARIPLIVFAGEAPLHTAWYNQAIAQRPFVEATGAIYQQLHNIESMTLDVHNAFTEARTKQCPVVLGVPFDLQEELFPGEAKYYEHNNATSPSTESINPASKQISYVAQRIVNARKIIVMAGRGVFLSKATAACIKLADQNNALLATTLPARGLFRNHPFSLGIAGGFSTATARRVFQEADLIIAIGTRLAHHNSDGGKLFSSDKVIHIDIHPRTISQGREASNCQIKCDANIGVNKLIDNIEQLKNPPAKTDAITTSRTWRTKELAQEIQTVPADASVFEADDYLDPRVVVDALDRILPESWTTINSSGHCSYYFAQMPRRPVEHFLTIREFGAIGNGIAFAIGAALARPHDPVVLFDGDGSLLMHIQELETIVRHKLNILICVLNDGAYGSEIHKLRAEGLSESGANFGRRDFARLASSFEAEGVVFTELEQLDQALKNFDNTKKPTIWDFHISDKIVSPVVQRSHGPKH